jgi:hypothetical protein
MNRIIGDIVSARKRVPILEDLLARNLLPCGSKRPVNIPSAARSSRERSRSK